MNTALHDVLLARPGQVSRCENVTFLFSDVAGFTHLTLALGDFEAHRLMRHHNAIVRRELMRHGGEELELMGDGFVLAFGNPDCALDCAAAIQGAFLDNRRVEGQWPIHVRIGVHTGPALRDEERYFGFALIQCARISRRAAADEILASADTRAASLRCADAFEPASAVHLRGFDATHLVYALRWHSAAPHEAIAASLTLPLATGAAAR